MLQAINSTEKDTECPRCGSADIKKKISAFSYCSFGGGSSFGPSRGFGGG
ncbi:MAG: hypothetical protein AB1638_06680 [Nitrospirota bacterium]